MKGKKKMYKEEIEKNIMYDVCIEKKKNWRIIKEISINERKKENV